MINAAFPAGNGGLSPHAGIRIQQRGIPRDMIEVLLRHGRQQHDHLGGIVVTFDNQTLERILRCEPAAVWRRASEVRSLYAVIDGDGQVITTGHRYRRVIRDRGISFFRSGKARNRRGEA